MQTDRSRSPSSSLSWLVRGTPGAQHLQKLTTVRVSVPCFQLRRHPGGSGTVFRYYHTEDTGLMGNGRL